MSLWEKNPDLKKVMCVSSFSPTCSHPKICIMWHHSICAIFAGSKRKDIIAIPDCAPCARDPHHHLQVFYNKEKHDCANKGGRVNSRKPN